MVYKNNVLAHRKRWALSQSDLAKLLGVSAVALSRYETRNRSPHLRLALGLEVVFGVPARALFPDRYAEVEAAIIRRAAGLSIRLEACSGEEASAQRELLSQMSARAAGTHQGV
jgi:transcriptional regulator with XRE-family HTH domain